MKALTHTDFNFPGQKSVYHGKVRDVYNINDELMVMVATDRISAFDVILPKGIPFKGQVLNQIAATFLDATSDIVPNWKLATPDPMVTVGLKCEGFRVEMIIRGYLTGSAWREYQNGCRELCGVKLPEGMKENQKFPTPIITPTTKADAGHDENISKEEIIAQGLVSKEDYELRKELEAEQKKAQSKDTAKGKKGSKKDAGQEKAADDDKAQVKDITVELKNMEDRMVRLTPNSSDMVSVIISKDGEKLYYLSAFEGGFDLWKLDLRKKDTKLLHKMNTGWTNMEMDKEGKEIFVLGGSTMQKMNAASETLKPISYKADMTMDLAAEREYMFNHVYKQHQKRFYNLNMHGIDWDAMSAAYRKFLPHISNNYDFAEMLSEWLGELNVSHTGGRYYSNLKGDATANLGLLYDWSYDGKGLLISEVVEKGPFDHARSKVKAGDIVEKINGKEITAEADYAALFNNLSRKKTLVSLYNPQTKERWEEVVMPISNGAFNELLYTRWVKQRAADVDKWSGGRLGYVHIQSMGDDSFRSVYSDILGKYNDREGIVIDTRFNGGGRLHEDIEILFSGKKYFTQVVRGREACDMPSRRWNKPSIMLQCEANYSNAHGTPWVYSHQKLGKLVGMPVPGTMTSVSWETLQDPSLVFGIPIIGYQLPDGSYLENTQLEPDIKVANAPETVVQGEDTQLKVAVDELLKEIDGK